MKDSGMGVIVKTITRITVWLIVMYGFYLILHGHLTPGGGFGGGVVLTLALFNVFLAYGGDFTKKWLNLHWLEKLEPVPAILFLVLAMAGLAFGSKIFFTNFLPKGTLFQLVSAGNIPLYNLFIGVKVGLSLFLAVWVLSVLKIDKGDPS